MGDLCLDVDSSTSHSPHESTSPSSSFYQSSSSPPPSSSSSSTTNKLVVSSLSYTIDPAKNSRPVWHCLTPKAKPINILKSVSFAASSSEILAVVGPSGTGKSTLLRVISGRVASSKFNPKSIALNGCSVTSPEQMRNVCGFVTQDDNLLPLLTVKETLMFSAHFRLKGWSKRIKEERICALMQELGLDHVADSYVGDEERRGISGGERKRVSIGVDVIHNPPILLLDEPTSGLDSTSALQVVELLSSMARTRQQILILTIHQPSYRILHHISTFLLLSRGRVAHCGSLGSLEETILDLGYRIPVQLNALEFAMEITRQLEDHHAKFNQVALRRAPTIHDLVYSDVDLVAVDKYCSMWDEIVSLSWRIWKIIYRTKELFLARTMQAVVGSLGLGSVFLHVKMDQDGVAERLGFFAFSLSFLLSSTVEALPIFLQERRVLMRESSRRMYRLSSYMLANTVVFAPFLLVVALLFAGPVYWLVGLNPSLGAFVFFALVVWLIVMMAGSLVLFLSAVSPDFILGNSLICMFLGVFFLFSGYFIPKESIPKYWVFMYYMSLYRYPLDSLLINEYWSLRDKCFSWQEEDGNPVCSLTGGDVLRNRGLEKDTRMINVGIMCGFFLVYRFLCWIVLVRKATKTTL
ncbi:ABC transporter G family member 23-like [Iris pallida]|uniref:ABC transporter G family member 23-like n=1 Tax=Iris pallida TaxID=29817 RepID=A0AAX6FRX2_IRIPA|nr:ABC transporter G family member 23-like [Iris pallida]